MGSQSLLRFIFILFILLSLSSCAGKPWTNILGEEESKPAETLFYQMVDRDISCSCCLDTDITIAWDSPVEKKSIRGLLQTMEPSSIKFVMTNPLGQILFALIIKDRTFQSINTLTHKYQSGSLDSLVLYYDAPKSLLSGNWVTYLTGRLKKGSIEIVEIRNDREKRGVWFTILISDGDKKQKNHLLIDMVEKKILTRMVVDENSEETIASITYSDWIIEKNCQIPSRLQISEFSFGFQMNIQLSNISTDLQLKNSHFKINPPPGYLRQILP